MFFKLLLRRILPITILALFTSALNAQDFKIQILHNNDGESNLFPNADGYGGVAQFSAKLKELRYQAWLNNYPSILLSSGDNFLPGPETEASVALAEGEAPYDARVFNELLYDAFCIGNHDFDLGPDYLARMIGGLDKNKNWPKFLSANLDFSGETALQALVESEKIAKSTILYRGDERIGVIGLTTPNLDFISSPRNVEVLDNLAEIVNEEKAKLEAKGINKIILISHLQGIAEDEALAATLSGIDIVIAGGGDEVLANDPSQLVPGDEIQGEYPKQITGADGNTVYVVTTGGDYKYVGNLTVTFNAEGIVTEIDEISGPIPVIGKVDTTVENIIQPVADFLAALESTVIGTTEVALDGVRNAVRGVETNEGNLIADAFLWQARELAAAFGASAPMVGIQNGGGIRNNNVIAAGSDITVATTYDILPFNNTLSVLNPISAERFKTVMENAVSRITADGPAGGGTGRFAQIAGFTMEYDLNGTPVVLEGSGTEITVTTPGTRVQTITLNDGTKIVENGQVVAGAPDISIATLSFIAGGGDQYPWADAGFTRLAISDQKALQNYIEQELGGIISADQYPEGGEGRIKQVDGDSTGGEETAFDLTPIGTYNTGIFDEGAAEVVAFDKLSKRLFFTNADANTVSILNIDNPTTPTLVRDIDMSLYGDGVNSVAVYNGLVAVASEAEVVGESGRVVFFDADGNYINDVEAGALPDMLIFSTDGTKVFVANEGEPNDDYTIDPEGSVTIIDVAAGAANATVTQVDFTAFNDKKASLTNKGVRIFGPNASVAQDLEPEYIALDENNNRIYVVLQENNAFAVVDLASNSVVDILPLGYKDHTSGTPSLKEYNVNDVPNWIELGTPIYEGGETVLLGGFSGMYFDEANSTADNYIFYVVPDRGPNDSTVKKADAGTSQNLRPFKLPNYQARIVKFTLNPTTGAINFNPDEQIMLTRQDGTTPISGRGNIPGADEIPVTYTDSEIYTDTTYFVNDVAYAALPYDEFGADLEGVLIDNEGNFWMCDEYRPAIYKFAPNGTLIDRFVAEGTAQLGDTPQPEGTYGAETLPSVYKKRRANRGFEAIAYDTDANIIYAFIQSPMYNPNSSTKNKSDVIRILGIDLEGTPVAEFVYLLERNRDAGIGLSRVDKMGDAVYIGNGKFLVLERDSSVPSNGKGGKKYVYEVNLLGATNILDTELSTNEEENTLETMTADELLAAGVTPVTKTKTLNLPSVGYLPSDKAEGISLLPDGSIAVMNDNDFGLAGAGITDNSVLGIISFEDDYGFDASNKSDAIDITAHPTLGMYLPDAAKTVSINDATYIVTANEGDSRDYDGYSEEERVKDLTLDATAYPNAATLQEDANLGRLKTTSANGDIDGDGDVDQIYSYGTRSFSIWDANGNLVFDSGDDFEQITAQVNPDFFNSTNDEAKLKNRSDDKGPEPEAIEIVERNGKLFALIGLERVGGIFVYDITDPTNATFVTYVNNRNFEADPTSPEALDSGVESIIYIAAEDAPNGEELVVTANEVSGTVTIFGVGEQVANLAEMIESREEAQLTMTSIFAYPNPTTDIINLEYAIAKSSDVNISIFDTNGRKVTTVFNGNKDTGYYNERISVDNLNMVAGLYFVSIQTEDTIKTLVVQVQ